MDKNSGYLGLSASVTPPLKEGGRIHWNGWQLSAGMGGRLAVESVADLVWNTHLTAMSYNFMRVFEEISKIRQPEKIHPSDKKYIKALEKRQQVAKDKNGFVNPLFFQARIARISSYTIRAAQSAIITGKSLVGYMSDLTAQLVLRPAPIGEH